MAEFGPAEEIAAGFARVNPARRAARRLLGIGPVVGACWVAALLTSRVWPGPGPAWVVAGLTLAGLIGLLAMAALGRRYRLAATGVAGCVGFAALDVALIVGVVVLAPVLELGDGGGHGGQHGAGRSVRAGAAARHGRIARRGPQPDTRTSYQ